MKDTLNFNENALKIIKERYLWKDAEGNAIETPKQMLQRVAHVISGGDEKLYKDFYEVMANLDFLPNTPTLMNAGRLGKHGQLSACYVLDVPDDMAGIYEALKRQALIHKTGGGTGFNFSKLRPKDSIVESTNGKASGPVSFMELFDFSTEKVMQGGMRRGANMGILNVEHPDIYEFIDAKQTEGRLVNFNLSVAITDAFMARVFVEKEEEAVRLWNAIIHSAHRTGDPGIIFIDTINRANTTPDLGPLEATNPCGETPLYANEACNLGSINLANFVDPKTKTFDYMRLANVVHTAVNFLDNVIDVNNYPLDIVTEAVKRTRKIGLGIMGWADALFKMGIKYSSHEACELAGHVMSRIQTYACDASRAIAAKKGTYPAWKPLHGQPKANATLTCIAPTGTISLLAGCSSGIEPLFAIHHERKAFDGKETFTYHHTEYEAALADPNDTRIADGVFETAHTISPEAHIRMQAAFQAHTDLAVSKTINLPHDATADDISAAFYKAWVYECKGITIYRDGSKTGQVLTSTNHAETAEEKCPECGGVLVPSEGCAVCENCGWSPCGV